MPTARAPWTPRRVTPPDAHEMDCTVAPRTDNTYPTTRQQRSRFVDLCCWVLGTFAFGALVTACVRSSDLFR